PLVRIKHMRDHAVEAILMLGERSPDQLQQDRMLQLALVQLIEIVGEAAGRIPEQVRKRYPAIPWQTAADMRNKLIHGYDAIEFDIVYDTVRDDLPALVQQLDAAIEAAEA